MVTPKIFHTDNGKEFTAKVVFEFLRHLNPNILAVTGRPRRPRDLGSVENVNKLVKRVIGAVLSERRAEGQNPNWTEILGSVAAVINSQFGRGKNDGYLDRHWTTLCLAVSQRPVAAGLSRIECW